MKYVSATEVQNHFGKYLKEAMMGEKIVITKNGKAIAQLVSETNKNQFVVDRLRGIVNYSATSNRASSLLKRSRKGYLLFLLDRVIYYGIVLAMRPVVQQANPGVPPVYITASYAASEQFFR